MPTMFHITQNIQSDKIHQCTSIYKGKLYNTISYDEDYLCKDDMDTGMHRSTIVAIPERKILSFSPPKTISMNKFKSLYQTLDDIVIHEYIDGRMIQLFYDYRILSWRINPIGKKGEVIPLDIDERAFISAAQGDTQKPLNDMAMLEYFPKNHCYTFIIRNQMTFDSSLFLVSIYKLYESNFILHIPQYEFQSWTTFTNLSGIICFPKPSAIGMSYADMNENIYYNYTPQKWILTNNQTGIQTSVSTNEYMLMKQSIQIPDITKYQYLCLQRMNKQDEYMNYFRKTKNDFYEIKQLYDQFIRNIHEMYINYYIKKCVDVIPLKYKNHLHKIHTLYYIRALNRNKPILMTKHIIKEYFDKKDPYEIKSLLNTFEYHY
jgi:hypothetical protein